MNKQNQDFKSLQEKFLTTIGKLMAEYRSEVQVVTKSLEEKRLTSLRNELK